MKAIRIHRFGGPEVLELEDVPVPKPRENELLVRIHAASVNPKFVGARSRGSLERCCRLPSAETFPGWSRAAEPKGAPSDTATRFIYASLGGIDRGSYGEYAVVRPNEAAPKPARLSHVEAAAVPLAGLTAWQGLFDHGHLEPGQTVLIHGGSGGVCHFAIQFAKIKGATVLTTASRQNLDFVRELGADQAIDYQSQRFEEIARDVELVLDLVGGETQERSWSA